MDYLLENKILKMAHYILENKTTIRATAKAFDTPKSTVHQYFNTKLKHINFSLYKDVKKLLTENFKIKHIHGGESTKNKYQKLKQVNNDDYVMYEDFYYGA